ncbi:MAG: segregation and condensation protein B [Lysobacterales bacterium]|jgi:segregation and condensation protein B
MSELSENTRPPLKQIIEAALLASSEPLSHAQIASLFDEASQPANMEINIALEELGQDCADRGVELKQVASGFRLQVKQSMQEWVNRLWTERPQRYSRAMLETLSLIAYRQPITRGEIESVRGVSLSSSIIRTMQERDWIRVVGHRDIPGKPALFGTTRAFLDHFDLKSLDDLPTLSEIRDMENLEPELDFKDVANFEHSSDVDTNVDASVDAIDNEL